MGLDEGIMTSAEGVDISEGLMGLEEGIMSVDRSGNCRPHAVYTP